MTIITLSLNILLMSEGVCIMASGNISNGNLGFN